MKNFEIGQEIETSIVAISGGYIFLDLNLKSEGVLEAAEFTDENGKLTVKEGDVLKVFFCGEKDGEMRFTSKLKGSGADNTLLENAYKNGIPIEGRVEKEIKGGYEVKIGDARAFCPYSQMGYKKKNDSAETYVGRNLTFRIQKYEKNGRNLLVSNRMICEDEEKRLIEGLQKKLNVGMTVKGTVKSIQDYGAFVDIDGFQALLPISEISRGRIADINEVLKIGQEIEAVIIKADFEHERVSLSMKSLLADPWDNAASKYPAGTKISGNISRITDFGLFVTLEDGLDGLVHISALDDIGRNTNLRKLYKSGDIMNVVVEKIDAAQKRISLKPVSSVEQDNAADMFMEDQDDFETYNPFAALLKK